MAEHKFHITEALIPLIDWREVFISQFGSRDEISNAMLGKRGQLIIKWSNDNGYETISSGIEKLVYRDGKLAFKPNDKTKAILTKYGYYEWLKQN